MLGPFAVRSMRRVWFWPSQLRGYLVPVAGLRVV